MSSSAPSQRFADHSTLGRADVADASRASSSWSNRLGVAFLAEVALMGALFVGYRQVRYLTKGDGTTARANALDVVGFEDSLGVYTERAVQRLALNSELIVEVLNRYYVGVHFPVTVAFLLWAFLRHRAWYGAIRAMFLSVTAAALVIHVLYPLAPPRLIGAGFVDTLDVYGPDIYSSDTSASVANQFAAMPSLHFGWAVLVALGFMAIRRTRRSALVLLHPAVTLVAIVATGNHYWLDAGVALVLVAVAAVAVQRTRFWPTEAAVRLDDVQRMAVAPTATLARPPARHAGRDRCERRLTAAPDEATPTGATPPVDATSP